MTTRLATARGLISWWFAAKNRVPLLLPVRRRTGLIANPYQDLVNIKLSEGGWLKGNGVFVILPGKRLEQNRVGRRGKDDGMSLLERHHFAGGHEWSTKLALLDMPRCGHLAVYYRFLPERFAYVPGGRDFPRAEEYLRTGLPEQQRCILFAVDLPELHVILKTERGRNIPVSNDRQLLGNSRNVTEVGELVEKK